MSLRVKDVVELMELSAPVMLKESYDNVGLMAGDSTASVASILVALDCTLEVIDEAIEKGCNLIITHHPLLFRKPSSITNDTLIGRKIIKLIKNDISLYSSHTNLDAVSGGINDLICNILGFKNTKIMDSLDSSDSHSKNGIGRIFDLDNHETLESLCDRVKRLLELNHIRFSGKADKIINRVAVINGSGSDYFSMAAGLGADCIITGDTTYHYASDYAEDGIAIIDAGHFSTEWPAMKLFAGKLAAMLIEKGFQNPVIISDKTKDPYIYR